jgi:hypothetical protein
MARVATMPRLLACAIGFLGGCLFEADYRGTYACTDGRCPSGLTCVANACVSEVPTDGPVDTVDAREPALTCADPGVIASAGGTAIATTIDHPTQLSSMCDGFVMNGREAVYRIELAAGDQLLVSITGARKAYVIAQCVTPAPACLGNSLATAGNPIAVTPAAGPSFVIVDDENPAAAGEFTLTLTVQ